MIHRLRFPGSALRGTITLAGSKSLSNRALIVRALCPEPFPIEGLANARDTVLLDALLQSDAEVLDAGAAGTTFRFLTAYLAFGDRERVLTGSERMKQRPVGLLVEALRSLGARIEYLAEPGYPPLRIFPHSGDRRAAEPAAGNQVRIPAGTSSQYISALLLLGPTLPRGLDLRLEGEIVSRPYIEMTLRVMAHFGAVATWTGQRIEVPPQTYQPRPFRVEADWSAASYYYAMASLSDTVDLSLGGLFADSLQGDAELVPMMEAFGVQTEFLPDGVRLTRSGRPASPAFQQDFLRCPDLAQTLAVVCAGSGVPGYFTGLRTLRIKETDRIAALQHELAKVGVRLRAAPAPPGGDPDRAWWAVEGRADVRERPCFATYEDHRMAMAFAPLALLGPIAIAEPQVVDKSYPDFWRDLESLGFVVREMA